MAKTVIVPVICEQRALDAKFPKDIMIATGETLRISALGVEAHGWSITLRQLYLVLEDAARGARHVKDA